MLDINDLYDNNKLFDGRYKLLRPLSTEGGSADVWLAIDINTIDDTSDESNATKVAIKIYRPKNFLDIEGENQFRSEFKKVFNCHHENIIQPSYFSIYEDRPYLVLPYCPAGSSEMMIGQFQKKDDLWKYIYEVSSGLAYLHEHTPQIIHQDIKPANVLIDDNGNYAITDFGISVETGGKKNESDDENEGTFAYMAPERFNDDSQPIPESDIWAFGATLYELITGKVPFGDEGGFRQKKNSVIPVIKEKVPESIKDLIYKCLAFDPKNRPTARSIVDTVLKKRYSRSKRTIAILSAIVVIISAVTLYVVFRNNTGKLIHVNSLIERVDSIADSQFSIIAISDSFDTDIIIKELEKTLVLYHNVLRDTPTEYENKQKIIDKIKIIKQIVNELREYERAFDLAEKALMSEMEDEFVEYSLLKENYIISINQLIKKLK